MWQQVLWALLHASVEAALLPIGCDAGCCEQAKRAAKSDALKSGGVKAELASWQKQRAPLLLSAMLSGGAMTGRSAT